jgi:hypothetical protein
VTAALRHAAEAAALIVKFRTRGELPLRARKAYSSRILHTANSLAVQPMYRHSVCELTCG